MKVAGGIALMGEIRLPRSPTVLSQHYHALQDNLVVLV